ncbi:glycoside hydrolase family 30 protein [Alteromonas sp. NFXS44]|uniref:glycoside hydrolase family 30 protein n=1 Tax=Alteromonas sp. NFXS44 TaxID=2818435 RepID=UPI0032DEE9E9
MPINRRQFLAGSGGLAAAATLSSAQATVNLNALKTPSLNTQKGVTWVSSTQARPWQERHGIDVSVPGALSIVDVNVYVEFNNPQQTIKGFGGAFSELGWQALSALTEEKQQDILELLFDEQQGANFTICRTPVAANDFALKWYSYNDRDGDFAMKSFSVKNDESTLIPFINSAQAIRSELTVWGSPWSPPVWMKTNGHYAMSPSWPGAADNGIKPSQTGSEGNDYFRLEDKYLKAYALYFRKYVESYAEHNIEISAVMPQNEWNSAQPFPSCCWTPEGLARFIPYLGKEMDPLGVDVLLGTLERPSPEMVNRVLANDVAADVIKGVGVQWAGKGALPYINKSHPELAIWGTEQECGTGTNDWHYARYAWGLLKKYIQNGAGVYEYWNMILGEDPHSTWGWPQNSLLTIQPGGYRINPEYYLMRHLSSFVKPGATYIPATSFTGYENQLAFKNPDGSLVLVIQNEMAEPLTVKVSLGEKLMTIPMPADSFNTIVVDSAML